MGKSRNKSRSRSPREHDSRKRRGADPREQKLSINMNIPTLLRTISRSCYQALTNIQRTSYDGSGMFNRGMHSICSNKSFAITERTSPIIGSSEFLKAQTPSIIQNCGFKVRGLPKLRCKDCYFVIREERRYVFCKSKPRHKQMSMKAKPKKSWILSHATQGPQRAW